MYLFLIGFTIHVTLRYMMSSNEMMFIYQLNLIHRSLNDMKLTELDVGDIFSNSDEKLREM